MGGGVCTYLRRDIPCKRLVECESLNFESLWLHLRPDSGILDWLMTNRPSPFKVTQLPKIGSSDHFSILATPILGSIPLPVRKTQVQDLRDSAWRVFGRWLTTKNWSHILSIDTCKEKCNTFIMELQNAVDTYLPWKSVRVHPTDRPWTTRKIKILIKKRQEAFARDGKDSATYKRLRNKVQREIKSTKYHYFHHKIGDLETTDQKKSLLGQDIKSEWHRQFLGDSCPDTYSLANKVNSYFISLTSDFEPLKTSTPLRQEVPPRFLVNTTEVRKALSGIKIGKAIGPDMLALPIMDIYNCSLSEGYVPDLLKSSIVNPLLKVSPPQEIDSDLRPISLSCTLAKIMEGFCRSRLVVQIGDNLDLRQYAREGHSTVDALIYLLHAIHEATDTGNCGARMFFADFSKGFDLIDHNILLKELAYLRTHPMLINWIKAFLTNRMQAVRIGDSLSDWKPLRGGIP